MITTITEFWDTHHNLTLSQYGFDQSNPNHFSFVGRHEDGSIHSVFILIPYEENSHVAHICSIYKSKILFKFIENTIRTARKIKSINRVICQDQGKPEFRISTRLAEAFGFTPLETKFGWTDYIWDTKS